MANQIDGGKQNQGAVGGIDQEQKSLSERASAQRSKTREREEPAGHERERLAPGLDAGGEGEAGADPSTTKSDGNSNT